MFTQRRTRGELLALEQEVRRQHRSEEKEARAMQAGGSLRGGARNIGLLMTIADWKSPRRRELIRLNPEVLIEEVLDYALSARQAVLAIHLMTVLQGIGIPMASAIMTCVNAERFTVIDIRALSALGVDSRKVPITLPFYAQYLDFCQAEAARLGLSLRMLDRALWQAGGSAGV